jgi:hypothetical protein
MSGKSAFVLRKINLHRNRQLPEVAQASDPAGGNAGFVERRQQNGNQQRDDTNHHQ